MDYTKSSVSRIMLILIGVLIGLMIVGGIYSYFDANNNSGDKKPSQQKNVVFPTATPVHQQVISQTPIISGGANPASEFCKEKGGIPSIQTKADGGQYGLCNFESGMACEEWALYRGECPVGGVRTTGFDTVEQKYCAWSGGSTLAVENAVCTFKNGSKCPVTDYYYGFCKAN